MKRKVRKGKREKKVMPKRLRRKDIEPILQTIKEVYRIDFPKDYLFYETSKGKIYIVTPLYQDFDFEGIRIDKGGFYLCERKGNFVRLSMQGAQMLETLAKKQKQTINPEKIITLQTQDYLKYMKGEDLKTDLPNNNSILLSHKDQIVCWAQIKDGEILNYLPKAYRGTVIVEE